VLHADRWKYRTQHDAKYRHLRTIAQVCRAISSQLKHTSTIGKKLVKQQYLPHMFLQYGELRSASSRDRFVSLGHPGKFQRIWHLASITAQPNFGVEQRAPPVFGRAAITLGIFHISSCVGHYGESLCLLMPASSLGA